MTTGEALSALLSADPTVVALVGTRISPDELPEGSPLPAIVYTVVVDVPVNSFTGSAADRLRNVMVQIDCYARPTQGAGGAYKGAQAVADAVDAALTAPAQQTSSFSAVREASRNLLDNETQYRRVSMDFSVWR
jgi:hypothetical protein